MRGEFSVLRMLSPLHNFSTPISLQPPWLPASGRKLYCETFLRCHEVVSYYVEYLRTVRAMVSHVQGGGRW